MIERKVHDRGCYIIILHLKKDTEIAVGELGNIPFRKGYYLYAGSAKKALTKRIERHQRLRKNLFWHIDYLRETDFLLQRVCQSAHQKTLNVPSRLVFKRLPDWSDSGFGCSDCSCKSHLFGMDKDPVKSPSFIEMLYTYRMKMVEDELEKNLDA